MATATDPGNCGKVASATTVANAGNVARTGNVLDAAAVSPVLAGHCRNQGATSVVRIGSHASNFFQMS
jgi:hypothetical protein